MNTPPSDYFNVFFESFAPQIKAFNAASICGSSIFQKNNTHASIHILASGNAALKTKEHDWVDYREPTLFFLPAKTSHQLRAEPFSSETWLVCGSISVSDSYSETMLNGLPDITTINLALHHRAQVCCSLLINESTSQHKGKQVSMDWLMSYLLIIILRDVVDQNKAKHGVLAGLADEHIGHLLAEIHACPSKRWHLEDMAELTSLSKEELAPYFKKTIGHNPQDYLMEWRFHIAQLWLKNGRSVDHVAHHIGYSNVSSFSRAFSKKIGHSPREWLHQFHGDHNTSE